MTLYKKERKDSMTQNRTITPGLFEPINNPQLSFKQKVTNLSEFLTTGLIDMGLSLSAFNQQQLLNYVDLIIKWNRAYNLTSVREPEDIVVRHIFDSLSASPFLAGDLIADIGSGAGLPGIPLALANPNKQFTLIDSNGKKARFLFHVVHTLGLTNVRVINERVEGFQKSNLLTEVHRFTKFDTIISRAYTSMREMLFATEHLVALDGMFIAMKGVYPLMEIHEIPEEFRVVDVHSVIVPHLHAERHILKVKML